MRRFVVLLSTLLLGSVVGGSSAAASTTIGVVDTSSGQLNNVGRIYIQTTDATGKPSFAVPAGGGVVTQLSARGFVPTIVFVRGRGAGYDAVGSFTASTFQSGGPETAATRIKVQPGDRLAVYIAKSGNFVSYNNGGGQFTGYGLSSAPSAGAGLSLSSQPGLTTGYIDVSAVVEPDADDDGYGDETQDSCPTSASVHEGPCTTDLQVSASSTAAALTVGEVAVVTGSVKANGSGLPVSVNVLVPGGLRLLALTASGGDCTGTACSLGSVPAGATRSVIAVVQAAAAGPQTLAFAASGTGGALVSTADDTAGATITVATAAAVAAPIRLCTIPKLKGLTKATATKKLTDAGCAVGKVSGPSKTRAGKKAKVKTQTLPSKLQVVAGTKVGFRLG